MIWVIWVLWGIGVWIMVVLWDAAAHRKAERRYPVKLAERPREDDYKEE